MYTEIKKIEDAYKLTGKKVPEISGENTEILTNINHLIVVSEAIREGWKPDYNNGDCKYFPWFDMETDSNNPSGFRFCGSIYTVTSASAVLGPLLCQESREKSDYMAKQFEDVFRKVMN